MDPVSMITCFKTAIDLAKTIKDYTDDIELKSKTAELYTSIISLQGDAMSMQSENHTLLQENHSLREKLMNIEKWQQDSARYELREISPMVFVYSTKEVDDCKEPKHWICAKCYENNKKSILQKAKQTPTGTKYICHNCGSEICDHSDCSKFRI